MPVVAPVPVTALPAPAPQTNDPTNFATRGDLLLAALPANVTQMNALAANVLNNAQYVELQATAGLASSNYKGLWSSLTGALNMPASVYHAGFFWQLEANLANVTTATPGVSASWRQLVLGLSGLRGYIDGELVACGAVKALADDGSYGLNTKPVNAGLAGGTGPAELSRATGAGASGRKSCRKASTPKFVIAEAK